MISFVIIALLTILTGCGDFSSSKVEKPIDMAAKKVGLDVSDKDTTEGKFTTDEYAHMDIEDEEPDIDNGSSAKGTEELPSRNLNTRDLAKIFAVPLNCNTRDNLVFSDGTIVCYNAKTREGDIYDIVWLKDGEITSTYRAPERFSILLGRIIDDDTFAIMGYERSNGKFLQFFNRTRDICRVNLGAIENHETSFVIADGSVVLTEFIGKLLPDTSVSWFQNCERVARFTRTFVSRDGRPASAMSAPVAMADGRVVVTSVENVDMNSFKHKLLWLNRGQLEHQVEFVGHRRNRLMPPGRDHQSLAFFESNGGYFSWYRNGVFESEFYLHHIVSKPSVSNRVRQIC